MASRYAAETEVPVARSKASIEQLLIDHGATEYVTGWNETHDQIQFRLFNQLVRFTLPRPDRTDKKFTRDARRPWVTLPANSVTVVKRIEQADRQRWRALYLVIRAKIEAVEAGIAVFEQEFLAFIVQPGGLTIGDILVPRLQAGQGVAGLLPPPEDAPVEEEFVETLGDA